MSNKIDSLLAEYDETLKVSQWDLADFPPAAAPGLSGRIRQARFELPKIAAAYEEAIRPNTVAIFVSGTDDQEQVFAGLAAQEGGTITVRADALYQTLAAPVERALAAGKGRQFTAHFGGMVSDGLRDVAAELGIASMNNPSFSAAPILADRGAVVGHIREAVRTAVGDQLNAMYIARMLANVALQTRQTGAVIPVVVIGTTPGETEGVSKCFGRVGANVALPAEQEVTKEFVLKVFSDVKKSLKKK